MAELVELSRRWAADGRQIRLNDVIAKGGTLRRTGSLRHRHTKVHFSPLVFIYENSIFASNFILDVDWTAVMMKEKKRNGGR